MRVLGFGTYDVRRHPRVQVLLDGLAVHGVEVGECNAPIGLSTAERVSMLRQPWRLPRLIARLLSCWSLLTWRSLGHRGERKPDAVLVGYLGHFDVVLARLVFPRTTVVLDHLIFAADTAVDRGAGGGLRGRLLTLLDHTAMRCADVIVVDTEEHGEMVPRQWHGRVVVVPVGADERWFDAASSRAAGPESHPVLSVVFFGLMTPLQGAPVVAQALQMLAGRVRATVIGDGQDSEEVDAALETAVGITRQPWVEPEQLRSLVASHDVCLGIFGTSGKARRVVPNKVYQGAAAGCAVVTSDSPPQRRALGESGVFVPPGDPLALSEVLAGLAESRERVDELRAESARRARSEFTSAAITAGLVERLRSALR